MQSSINLFASSAVRTVGSLRSCFGPRTASPGFRVIWPSRARYLKRLRMAESFRLRVALLSPWLARSAMKLRIVIDSIC